MRIIGIKPVSFNRKSDGRHIEGVELHYTFESKNIEGVGCDTVFISQSVIEENYGQIPGVGDEVALMYNRFGKVAGFVINNK